MTANLNRPLSAKEQRLARWMLENGNPDAAQYLPGLANAEVTPTRCPCGCASINFKVPEIPDQRLGIHVLGDFLIVKGDEVAGIYIFESKGVLGGIEVYSSSDDAPKEMPAPEDLMTYEAYGRDVYGKK